VAKGAGSILLMVILGAVLGGCVGELLGVLIPSGLLHDVFVKGFPLGFPDPWVLNLKVVVIKFGFTIMFNVFSFLGILAALYASK